MTQQNLVRIYQNIEAAETAVKRLRDKNFPSNQISIVTQNIETPKQHNFMSAEEWAAVKGIFWGAQLGGLLGVLVAAAFIWPPDFSPLFIVGPFSVSLLVALKGMAAGAAAGALLSSLVGFHPSKEKVINDEEAVKGDQYLVVVHGDEALLSDARILLGDLSDHRKYPVDAEKILRFLS